MASPGYDASERLPGSHYSSRNPLGEGGVPAFTPPPGETGPVPYHGYPPPEIPPPQQGSDFFHALPGFAGSPEVNPNYSDEGAGQNVHQVVTVGQGQNVEVLKGMQGMSLMFLAGLAVLVLLIR